jgi:glycosyltransferase involved in cell wall biosynthesis
LASVLHSNGYVEIAELETTRNGQVIILVENHSQKICIFGSQVASALQGNTIGGAELQMAMLAKVLAGHGVKVVVIDRETNESYQIADNIRIEGIPGWYKGIRGLRFITHRVPNFIHCLRKTEASVFYVRGCSYLFLIPLYVAKRFRAKFVLAISHDSELWRFPERHKVFYKNNSSFWDWISTNLPNELAIFLLIRFCDILLVQHEYQAKLAQGRGKKIILLPNMIDGEVEKVKNDGIRKNVVIVGALSNRKGLNILIPIIKTLQQIVFEFVGEAEDIEGSRIKKELKECPNVILNGWLDRKHTLNKIACAKVLLNTSKMEGFPNAFIEAWALRTPVISLYVDPGGLIKTHQLGYVCDGNIQKLESLLQKESYGLDLERIQKYIVERHSAQHTMNVFEDIFTMTQTK